MAFRNCRWTQFTIFFEPIRPYLIVTMKTPKKCLKSAQSYQQRRQNDVVVVPLLKTLDRYHTLFCCFHCWLWTSKCPLGVVAFWPFTLISTLGTQSKLNMLMFSLLKDLWIWLFIRSLFIWYVNFKVLGWLTKKMQNKSVYL